MCLILDASKYGDFLDSANKDMEPVRKWLGKKGKLAYSPTEKFEQELSPSMKSVFHSYMQAGKVKQLDPKEVQDKQSKLTALKSDDPHIIALAKVADVKLLISGDQNLHEDFKTIVGGRIYQTREHKRLLDKTSCP